MHKIVFILILIISIALRFYNIADYNNGLSYDELYSYHVATSGSFLDIFKQLIETDYHPPLYFWILSVWIKIFSNSDIALHSLSAVISVFTVWISYLLGKQLIDRKFGLFLMGYIATNAVIVVNAQFVRFYPLAVLFAFLSIKCSVRLFDNNVRNKHFIYLLLTNLLLLLTQTTSIFFVFFQTIFLGKYLYEKDKHLFIKFLKYLLYGLFLSFPILIMYIIQFYNSRQTFWGNPWEWINMNYESIYILKYISNFLFGVHNNSFLLFFLAISMLFLFIFTIRKRDFKLNIIFYTLILYQIVFQVVTFFCNIPIQFHFHYLIIFPLALCIMYFIYSNLNKFARLGLYIILLIINLHIFCKLYVDLRDNRYFFSNSPKIVVDSLNKYANKKILLFAPYGDKLIKKYNNKLETFEINRDYLFTMKNYQNEFSKLSSIDFKNMNHWQKKTFVEKYLLELAELDFLKNRYNDKINKLNIGDYFICIITMDYIYAFEDFQLLIDDFKKQDVSKSHAFMVKLTTDMLEFASNDSRLLNINNEQLNDIWAISVYKKVRN